MAVVNQLERDLIRMRQRKGIELAKKEGRSKALFTLTGYLGCGTIHLGCCPRKKLKRDVSKNLT